MPPPARSRNIAFATSDAGTLVARTARLSEMRPTTSEPARRLRTGQGRLPLPTTGASAAAGTTEGKEHGAASPVRRERSMAARDFIRVVGRIRPKLPDEVKVNSGVECQIDGRTIVVSNGRGDRRHFTVDQIFDSQKSQGSQLEVFAQFGRDLVNHSLRGYNVCIFAYGHTGTGKTYTMLGDSAAQCSQGHIADGTGLLPRFLGEVFRAHEESEGAVRTYRHYTCEYYEVYNEQIKDLLLPMGVERTRRVHVHPRHGVRIENLTTSVVASASEALQLVAYGNQMRAVAATTMNARSSRSHAIFTFRHEETQDNDSLAGADSCSSTVTLVDLAGREDQAVSRNRRDQFREMCFINTSLFHLTHVIQKLADGPQNAGSLSDFRNSKLTLLLSPALIGNCRTALVATVAPGQNFYEDTVSTMQFATSVKKIQTRPIVNNKTPNALIAELEAEVKQLQQDLAVSKTHGAEKEQALLSAQAIISSYRRTWDDLMHKSDEHRMIRQGSLASIGIHESPISSQGLGTGTSVLFLTKLCDDPPLQGHCNFFLNKPVTVIGSDADECDIILEGLGINPKMCEVRCDGSDVEVHLIRGEGLQGGTGCTGGVSSVSSFFGGASSSSSSRVLVNGHPLSDAEPCQALRHGDCIFLGYAHAFRLVKQDDRRQGSDAPGLARATLPSLDVASAATEVVDVTGAQYNAVLPFVSHLSSRASKEKVQAFLRALHVVCPLVDEANLITGEVMPLEGIHMELHALTDVFKFSSDFPELIVVVLQDPQRGRSALSDVEDASTSSSPVASPQPSAREANPLVYALGLQAHMKIGGEDNLLYVWSLEKFLWRLSGMRDVYQEGSEARDGFRSVRARMASQPALNPWHEATFTDVQLLAATDFLSRTPQSNEEDTHLPVATIPHGDGNDAAQVEGGADSHEPGLRRQRGRLNLSSHTALHEPSTPPARSLDEFASFGDQSRSLLVTPPSRDTSSLYGVPPDIESDTFASAKRPLEVEQLCAEVLQLQKVVRNLSSHDTSRLREGDEQWEEVLPEIEQRLAEMDVLQKQLKDDTKRYIDSPESLQKLEALRLYLSKLVKQGLQDHMQRELKSGTSTSAASRSGGGGSSTLRRVRGRANSTASSSSSRKGSAASVMTTPRDASRSVGEEDVLVYCPSSTSQPRRMKAKARAWSVPDRLPKSGRQGVPSQADKDVALGSGPGAAGGSSTASSVRQSPCPIGNQSSRLLSGAAGVPELRKPSQGLTATLSLQQPGSPQLSARQTREQESKSTIPVVPARRIPFTPRQEHREATTKPAVPPMVPPGQLLQPSPRTPLQSSPRSPVLSPQQSARDNRSDTGLCMRPALVTNTGQNQSQPGLVQSGSLTTSGSFAAALNAGSFVSCASGVVRTESGGMRIASDASTAQFASAVSLANASPTASPTSTSPRRTRHFIGPYPRVTWAYYEVTEPDQEVPPLALAPAAPGQVPSLTSLPSQGHL